MFGFFIMIRVMQLKLYRKAKCFLNVYSDIFCFVMFCTDFKGFLFLTCMQDRFLNEEYLPVIVNCTHLPYDNRH